MNWKAQLLLELIRYPLLKMSSKIFGIMEMFPHRQFDRPPFDNDIMLLKVLF